MQESVLEGQERQPVPVDGPPCNVKLRVLALTPARSRGTQHL